MSLEKSPQTKSSESKNEQLEGVPKSEATPPELPPETNKAAEQAGALSDSNGNQTEQPATTRAAPTVNESEKTLHLDSLRDRIAAARASGDEADAVRLEKSILAIEKSGKAGKEMSAVSVERAKNLSERAFETIKNLGESYNKLDWKTKVAIGGTFLVIGLATAGTGATALGGMALVASRTASGIGMLATIDGVLTKAGVQDGLKRRLTTVGIAVLYAALVPKIFEGASEYFGGTISEKLNQAVTWAADTTSSTIDTAGKILGAGAADTSNIGMPESTGFYPDIDTHNPQPNRLGIEDVESVPEVVDHGDLDSQNPQPNRLGTEDVERSLKHQTLFSEPIQIQKGDNLWKIIEGKLAQTPGFADMDAAGKTWWIDHYKDQFAALSPEKIKELGISSGDINKLKIGEVVDLRLLDAPNFYENSAISAGALSPEAQASINSNNAKIAEFAQTNPEVGLTEERVDSITQGEPATSVETFANGDSGGNGEARVVPGSPEFQRVIAEYKNEIAQDLFGKKGMFGLGSVNRVDKFNTFVAWRSASEFVGKAAIDAADMGIAQTEATKLKDFLTLSVQQYNIPYQGRSVGAVINDIALAQGTAVLA